MGWIFQCSYSVPAALKCCGRSGSCQAWGEVHAAPHRSAALHLSHLTVPKQAAGEKADGSPLKFVSLIIPQIRSQSF